MSWKLHNAMWPGLVGKEEGSEQPPISLDRMLQLTKDTEVAGRGFDGVDLFLCNPHLDIDAGEDEIKRLADGIADAGLNIGSVVAPVWPGAGGGSAMGDDADMFVSAVEKSCRYAKILNEHGVRQYGSIRIDSATSVEAWDSDRLGNTKKIADTFRRSGEIAQGYGEKLVAEGEICWGGMHSWQQMTNLLEETGMPETVGFQADLAHTYLYLLGYNAEEDRLLDTGYSDEQFWEAYATMTKALRPWTFDFHVAQNDGTVHGSGSHDKTGRHCKADDPNGKLDVVRCASHWLLDENGHQRPEIKHLCWDGCMFDNKDLETPSTWQQVLQLMQQVNQLKLAQV